MKKVGIVQSSYIPWKGYFDLIARVDEFILLEDVQFTRRDWRNRNRIKTAQGTAWLTIPVTTRGRYQQTIAETRIGDPDWGERHWRSIEQWYARARCFPDFAPTFEPLFRAQHEPRLSLVNRRFIEAICAVLGCSTPIRWSWEFELVEGRSERLLHLCEQAGAAIYVSGPSARDYLDVAAFERRGIGVEWMDYSGYPEYRQLFPPFEHGVSVLDLIFNEGPDAPRFLLGA